MYGRGERERERVDWAQATSPAVFHVQLNGDGAAASDVQYVVAQVRRDEVDSFTMVKYRHEHEIERRNSLTVARYGGLSRGAKTASGLEEKH